jgi:hypothetical protein
VGQVGEELAHRRAAAPDRPKRSAIARPKPFAPPVTITTRPAKERWWGRARSSRHRDEAELGEVIAAHPDDLEAALAEYEQAMFPRAAEAAGAEDTYDLMLGDDAPWKLDRHAERRRARPPTAARIGVLP